MARGEGGHKWKPGQSGNPKGRVKGAIYNFWRPLLKEIVTPEEFRKLITALLEAGKGGDTRAASLLLRYLIPHPGAMSTPLEGTPEHKAALLAQALVAGEIDAAQARVAGVLALTPAGERHLTVGDIADALKAIPAGADPCGNAPADDDGYSGELPAQSPPADPDDGEGFE